MSSKKYLNPASMGWLATIAAGYIRLVGRTCRWEMKGVEPVRELHRRGDHAIFALWHNRVIIMPYLYRLHFRRRRMAAIVSRSRDGELVGRVIAKFGVRAIRGSSSRGGREALLALSRSLRAGWDAVVTPDGPRGPRYQVQEGIISLASITGAPVVPVSYADNCQVVLRASWDHMRIPLPFGRITVVLSEPLRVDKRLSRSERRRLAGELGERLRKADREAEGRG